MPKPANERNSILLSFITLEFQHYKLVRRSHLLDGVNEGRCLGLTELRVVNRLGGRLNDRGRDYQLSFGMHPRLSVIMPRSLTPLSMLTSSFP